MQSINSSQSTRTKKSEKSSMMISTTCGCSTSSEPPKQMKRSPPPFSSLPSPDPSSLLGFGYSKISVLLHHHHHYVLRRCISDLYNPLALNPFHSGSGFLPQSPNRNQPKTGLDLNSSIAYQFQFPAPSLISGYLLKLRDLIIWLNQLSGEIPQDPMNLGSLEKLILGFNELTGTIPFGLSNCTNLNWISLANNKLRVRFFVDWQASEACDT